MAVQTIAPIQLGHQLLINYSQHFDDVFPKITNRGVLSVYHRKNFDDGDNYKDKDFNL